MRTLFLILFIFPFLSFSADKKNLNRDLTFINQDKKIIKVYSFSDLNQKFKTNKIKVFNYVTQKLETYNAFDLSLILDQVYGINIWKNSYAIGTVSTDMYAPLIQNNIYSILKPYLAYERADGEKFENKKSFSSKPIPLFPYYIIWKSPKSIGNLKKVRDHWPWKINTIFLYQNEPTALKSSAKKYDPGKLTFINHCIACHSLNNIGGTKSDDLIKIMKDKKLTDQYMEDYIFDPRIINPKSKMPHFPIYLDNKREKIKELILYLRDKSIP